MENSKIAWTDNTFNPWEGCTRVSPGCQHCYAEGQNKRFRGGRNWGPGAERRRQSETYWLGPPRWEHQAAAGGKRIRVFCGSICDAFDLEAPVNLRKRLFEIIRQTPHLDWQLLTKRPENIDKFLPRDWGQGWTNVWLGCTVEDRCRLDQRFPILRRIPARVRFLSCEPLLEDLGEVDFSGMHWVIVGGESGRSARPFDLGWARVIQLQCKAQGIPFFSKQLGARPVRNGAPIRIQTEEGKHDLHADDFDAWPHELESLMVREFPETHTVML